MNGSSSSSGVAPLRRQHQTTEQQPAPKTNCVLEKTTPPLSPRTPEGSYFPKVASFNPPPVPVGSATNMARHQRDAPCFGLATPPESAFSDKEKSQLQFLFKEFSAFRARYVVSSAQDFCQMPFPTLQAAATDLFLLIESVSAPKETEVRGPDLGNREPDLPALFQPIEKLDSESQGSACESDENGSETKFSRSTTQLDDFFEGVNDYILVEEIGRGVQGKVMRGIHEVTGENFAIKIVPRSNVIPHPDSDQVQPDDIMKFQKEIAIMKRLKHKNIARLREVIDDPDEGTLYLVLPLLNGGPILRFDDNRKCNTLSNEKIKNYMNQIISGLQYLNKHNIVHRDLKPDNVLLTEPDGYPVLVDFGLASEAVDPLELSLKSPRISNDEIVSAGMQTKLAIGTPAFTAPEVFLNRKLLSPKADVWSLGVIAYAMIYGTLPFSGFFGGEGEDDLVNNICSTQPHYEDTDELEGWNSMLEIMLEKDPDRRCSLSELKRHRMLSTGAGRQRGWSVSSACSDFERSFSERSLADTEIFEAMTSIKQRDKQGPQSPIFPGGTAPTAAKLAELQQQTNRRDTNTPADFDTFPTEARLLLPPKKGSLDIEPASGAKIHLAAGF